MGSAVRAGPSAATIAASTRVAAPTPNSAERQLRVTPTASTIVNASTASTAQARNTDTARATSCPDTLRSMAQRGLSSMPNCSRSPSYPLSLTWTARLRCARRTQPSSIMRVAIAAPSEPAR